MMYLGDFALSSVVRFLWNSNAVAGESITRATNGTISVYKDNGTTQSTTGVTDTEDFDSLTGVHAVAVDTSADGTFYSTGSDFAVVLSAATIDGKTINAVLAHFSLNNRSALRPTTAGRTLDVSAGGEAGVDWANVGSPTTTVGLSGTTVKTATDVETDTADIQSRLPAALGANGNIKADVRDYSGTAGTFASGRPEVNTSHIAGSAVSTTSAQIGVNVVQISTDATAADNLEAAYDGTGYAHTGNTYPWTAAWDAEVQSEVDDALVAQRLDELLNADSDIDGAAPPTVGSVFHELMSKTAGSFTFDQTTDSLEALRDRGDAAWITATGFSTHSAADVWAAGTRTLTAATNITSTGGTTVPQTGDSYARLGAPAGASVSADIAVITADLPQRVTKNTALAGFTFPMLSSSDHYTPTAGLTVTAQRSIDGGAFASCANSVSEVSNGWYKIDLAAADLNGNVIALRFTATGGDATLATIITQPT